MTEKKYKINEIFYSLQGEGRWTGRAAIFVRFAGCNLNCPFCDTDFTAYEEFTKEQILNALQQYPRCKFVVLTGGEPTLQVDEPLTALLHSHGYYLSMETNGTHPVPAGIDWVTCSPKKAFVKGGNVRITRADEVKIVFDGEHPVSTYGIEADYFFVQPCDTGDKERNLVILKKTIEYVKSYPQWQLSLQTHKLVGVR